MVKEFFEKKKIKVKPICEEYHMSYPGIRERLKNDTIRFSEIRVFYHSGALNLEDIKELLE